RPLQSPFAHPGPRRSKVFPPRPWPSWESAPLLRHSIPPVCDLSQQAPTDDRPLPPWPAYRASESATRRSACNVTPPSKSRISSWTSALTALLREFFTVHVVYMSTPGYF